MRKSELDLAQLFGKDRGQEDRNLSKYFIKTGQYKEVYSGAKELVLGRKGTGKSSIFSQLILELPKDNVVPIPISPTGEDFALLETKLQNYADISFDDDFKYSLAWYELILTEIAFSIISEKNQRFLKGVDATLYNYVKKNERIKGDFVTQFSNAILKAFSGSKIGLAGAELNVDFSTFSEIDNCDQNKIKRALFKVITENSFFVLVDNLDEPWKNNKQMNSWLRGLILASRRLKRDFQNLKIVVFLRDDIYSEITTGSDIFDSRSEILALSWKDRHYFSLRQLLAARIALYFDLSYPNDYESIDEVTKKLFPLQIERNRNLVYTSTFIGSRTFYKPRDFLQFYRNALEISSTDERLPVSPGAIKHAEANYSSWKIAFIQGEYSKTYQGIDNCIDTFVGLTTDWTISYSQLVKHLEALPQESCIINITSKSYLSPKQAADFLFMIGFLRKVIQGYNRAPKFLTYMDEPIPRLHGQKLDIHPAFRTNLARR